MSGALLEVVHRDTEMLLSGSCPVLSVHECGAHEFHVPLDQKRQCPACTQSMQRLSTGAVQHLGSYPTHIYLASAPVVSKRLLTTDVLYSGKRGPPQS